MIDVETYLDFEDPVLRRLRSVHTRCGATRMVLHRCCTVDVVFGCACARVACRVCAVVGVLCNDAAAL
jgi:hypothetical protein